MLHILRAIEIPMMRIKRDQSVQTLAKGLLGPVVNPRRKNQILDRTLKVHPRLDQILDIQASVLYVATNLVLRDLEAVVQNQLHQITVIRKGQDHVRLKKEDRKRQNPQS